RPRDVNCRTFHGTYDTVGPHVCAELAQYAGISLDRFYVLNPFLSPDCQGIRPYTNYCTGGFIEPERAWDGRCGPKHLNATCLGMDRGQCCNSETWTCGNSERDCAPGVCYEGACWGHKVYTTDGACGRGHGGRQCAGKWGDCCSVDGACGTGAPFCSEARCQSGNCMSDPRSQGIAETAA
ncbi:hypothetical protein QBC34DRAFT_313805, partial [Podospora aff. communis PSN243]